MIRDSVRERDGLISGRYDGPNGTHCAVGCFFADNYGMGLHSAIVEEVAAFNDSIPETATPRQRRNRVLRWLNGRLFRMAISDLISGRSALYLPLLWRQS
jgi:hypothetical protein